VLLDHLGGNMHSWVFEVAVCVVCFRWRCVLLCLLGGTVSCWVFYEAM